MERTPEMQTFIDETAKKAFGRTQTEAQATDTCVFCGKPATEFKDQLSRTEYSISGICQICQDEVFESPRPLPKDK